MAHEGLVDADRLKLGVVRVWGAGSTKITEVTLTASGETHQLIPEHNLDSQVSTFPEVDIEILYVSISKCNKLSSFIYHYYY